MKKRKITDNIPLKIMSVAIAVVLWLIVVNIDNPTGTNYYTLNDVELINKEYVESSDTIGKMCMPEQNQDSIKVAITATKKIRDKIKVTDISEKDIPKANITREPAVWVQSRGVIDVVYYDKPFTFKSEMWAYTSEDIVSVKFLYYVLKNSIQTFRDAAWSRGSKCRGP